MKAVIFDFDGTIADSFPVAIDIFYEITGYEKLPEQEINRLRGMTVRSLAKEIGIPLSKVPWLLVRGKRLLKNRLGEVKLFPAMQDVIKNAPKEYKLFILSSNSEYNISEFLKTNDLEKSFTKIYSNVGLFSKAKILKRIMKDFELNTQYTWYVGDEVRDIQAAHKANVKVAAVTWGYNNSQVLKDHNPDGLITDPTELARCLYNN